MEELGCNNENTLNIKHIEKQEYLVRKCRELIKSFTTPEQYI